LEPKEARGLSTAGVIIWWQEGDDDGERILTAKMEENCESCETCHPDMREVYERW
jgi:hypothetical protein